MSSDLEVGSRLIMPIAEYLFDYPYITVEEIEKKPGVFAVVSEFADKHYLLDVDHSDDVKQAILNHERKRCWERNRKGSIRYAVLYKHDRPSEDEEDIEMKIRSKYRAIPCGDNQIHKQ